MRRDGASTCLGCAALVTAVAGLSGFATAQVNCATIPAGPDRTDCYIGLGRINREKSGMAADVARQQTDQAIYRSVTGRHPKKKLDRTIPARYSGMIFRRVIIPLELLFVRDLF